MKKFLEFKVLIPTNRDGMDYTELHVELRKMLRIKRSWKVQPETRIVDESGKPVRIDS